MSGLDSLLEALDSGSLVAPEHDRPNLVDLGRAVASLAGVGALDLSSVASDIREAIGETDHLVLVMADGVGMNMIESMPKHSFLTRHLHEEMLTVFPSTTSVALTSLTTGEWPAVHAVTGWWTHLPDLGAASTILAYTSRADDKDLLARGIDPARAFPVPSMWASIPRDVLAVVPERIAGSVYSRYFGGGRRTEGYASLASGVDIAIAHVSAAVDKTFTYLYVPHVDSLAHLHGITRPEVRHALCNVDRQIGRLRTAIESKARVVVTADHGFLDAPAPSRYTLRPTRRLHPLLRFHPSGDARVMYLHTWDWARDRVRRYFESRFGDGFIVVDVDDALRLGLYGPDEPTDEAGKRLGDLIAISSGANVLEYNTGRGPGRMVQLNSHHSGLSPQEMKIPLIVA